jgi:hypothetical protein
MEKGESKVYYLVGKCIYSKSWSKSRAFKTKRPKTKTRERGFGLVGGKSAVGATYR